MSADELYELLPALVRVRDAQGGYPLRDLLRVVAAEVDLLEDDISQNYENLFIETCAPWAAPYIGDLVGYKPLYTPAVGAAALGLLRPRRDIADTLRMRRRKGTLAVLEDLAAAVAGWSAQVEENMAQARVTAMLWRLRAYPLTYARPFPLPAAATARYRLNTLGNDAPLFARVPPHDQPQPLTRAMLRDQLETFYGAAGSLQIYADGRPVSARHLIVTGLDDWQLDAAELREWQQRTGGRDEWLALDPEMGRMMLPRRLPQPALAVSYLYGFGADLGGGEYQRPVPDALFGVSLFRPGHLLARGAALLDTLREDCSPFVLHLRAQLNPALLARIDAGDHGPLAAFERQLMAELNRVLQAADLSAGPIDDLPLDEDILRLLSGGPAGPRLVRLNRLLLEAALPQAIARSYAVYPVVSAPPEAPRSGLSRRPRRPARALNPLAEQIEAFYNDPRPPRHALIELRDSGLYVDPISIYVAAGQTLELRAQDGCRPVLVLPETEDSNDNLLIECEPGSRVVLDGLLVAGRAVQIAGRPGEVLIRHCTFVPGWAIDERCRPRHGEKPSLILTDAPQSDEGAEARDGASSSTLRVRIEHSILGSILIDGHEVRAEPFQLLISDSIVDATADELYAISGPGEQVAPAVPADDVRHAHATLTIARSTVIGMVRAHAIVLGENSIFTGALHVARRQLGCLRFCSVPLGSRTPRRYSCQPDMAIAAPGALAPALVAARLAPVFMSTAYGTPDYCRLEDRNALPEDNCALEIRQGADDESELGVFHNLYQPQRRANLEARLREYLPLGWELALAYGD